MKIQNADLAWTTLKSGGYINRPSTASGRTHFPAFIDMPSLDLASPHLPQRLHRDSFSESPSRQLNKQSVTDSREVRIARGQRPGIVYPLPRATRPDTRLTIDAALP